MRHGAFLFLFCLHRQPIIRLWLFATCRTPYYPRYTTNNRWRSVDAHFQDGAGCISLSLLPIKAANNSFSTVCNVSHHILPKIHDQQSLTLHWRSFPRWGRVRFSFSLPVKAANNWLMTVCNQSHPILHNIHEQRSLMLRWCSVSRSGRESIIICFRCERGQWFLYDCLQPIGSVSTQDAWPIIVDTPLTLS